MLNVSKTGVSVSIGPKGARVTMGTSGSRVTVGAPGTGLFYTHKFKGAKAEKGKAKAEAQPAVAEASPAEATPEASPVPSVTPLTPEQQEAFAQACVAAGEGREAEAVAVLAELSHHPDAAFFMGLLLLRTQVMGPADAAEDQAEEVAEQAVQALRQAFSERGALGQAFNAAGFDLALELPITDEVTVRLRPDPLGAGLALVESLQRLDEVEEGMGVLRTLSDSHPGNPLVQMSLKDLEEHRAAS
ncbi:MAG: DUF4236 domain-containing protein [Myxococcales bacterium]|nr:DUF4236 domain-containing protein [Myxococcales bacterium]